MHLKFLFIIFFLYPALILAQEEVEEKVSTNLFGITIGVGYDIPSADLGKRFGNNNEINVGFEYQFGNSKWITSFETDFFFGNKVKEDVLLPLRLDNGLILGINGAYANVFLRQRGVHIGLMLEKVVFPNENGSGLRLGTGIGVLNHYIRIQDDSRSVPQLANDYKKGYDRSARGLAIKERISYHFVTQSKRVNFSVGIEFTQGFTNNLRAINFDTALSDNDARLDLLYGLNLKWVIPIFHSSVEEEIFY